MTFFRELFLGVRSYFEALSYVHENRLWGFFIFPALLNLIIFAGISYLGYIYSGELIDYFAKLLELESENTLGSIAQFFLALVIRGIVIIIYFFFYRYLALIILAPVLALMAEKLHEIQTGISIPFSLNQLISDALRGAGIALKNLIRELTLTIVILIGAILIPPISIVAPPLIFTIESYFYGFSMIDYFNELKRMNARDSRDMIWSHKGLAIGNGAMFNILLFIPFIGVLIAPMLALTAAHLALVRPEKAA